MITLNTQAAANRNLTSEIAVHTYTLVAAPASHNLCGRVEIGAGANLLAGTGMLTVRITVGGRESWRRTVDLAVTSRDVHWSLPSALGGAELKVLVTSSNASDTAVSVASTIESNDAQYAAIIASTRMGRYFVSTTGNDANDGLTEATAKLTITAALGNNRVIHVGPGTFSGQVNASSYTGLSILGSGRGVTILTHTGADTLVIASTTIVSDLSVVNTGAHRAILVRGNDSSLYRVGASSLLDAVELNYCGRVVLDDVIAAGSEYGLYITHCTAVHGRNLVSTTAGWTGCSTAAIALETSTDVLLANVIAMARDGESVSMCSAMFANATEAMLVNASLGAVQAGQQTIMGIKGGANNTITLVGCQFILSGEGDIYDISSGASVIRVCQTYYDASRVAGATIYAAESSLVADAIQASKFDESTAFPLRSADSGSTELSRVILSGTWDYDLTVEGEFWASVALDYLRGLVIVLKGGTWGGEHTFGIGTIVSADDLTGRVTLTLTGPPPESEDSGTFFVLPSSFVTDSFGGSAPTQLITNGKLAMTAQGYTAARAVKMDNLDAAVTTRSSHSAADVWAVTTRTLSSFGTLVTDVATAIWAAASRTLTSLGFPGTGAYTVAVTVTDGTDPLEGATVSLTKGADVITLTSDEDGEATANLDNGAWTVAAFLSGYGYAGGTLTVSGANTTLAVEMDAITIPAAEGDNQTTAWGYTLDSQGNKETSISVHFELLNPTTPGLHGRLPVESTSDGNGLLSVTLLRSATWRFRRDEAEQWKTFTTDDAATFELPPL